MNEEIQREKRLYGCYSNRYWLRVFEDQKLYADILAVIGLSIVLGSCGLWFVLDNSQRANLVPLLVVAALACLAGLVLKVGVYVRSSGYQISRVAEKLESAQETTKS